MKLRKHRRRHHTLAYAVLSFIAFAIALPLVLGSRDRDFGFRAASVLAAARDSFSLSAPITLIPAAGLTLDAGTISIVPSQAASARSGEAILALLTGGSARLILEGGAFTFTSAAKLRANGAAPPADGLAPLLLALTESRFESLTIRHGTVALQQGDGSALLLADINAEVSLRRKGAVAAKGTFEFRGQTLSFDTTVALGDRQTTYRLPFKAAVKGALIDISLDGRLSLGEGLQVSSQNASLYVTDMRRTANWLGASWPDGPGFKKFRADGHLDWNDRTVSFQSATFEMDGNVANGTLLAKIAGPRPSFEATLAAGALDFTSYYQPSASEIDRKRPLQSAIGALTGHPGEFALPVIMHFDADLRLSADRVTAGPLSLGRSAATLSLKNGRLMADIADVEVETGTRGQGQFTVDMAGAEPRYTLRGKISQLETSRIATFAVGQLLLRGRGDVVLDLAATGDTAGRLTSTLGGKVALTLPAGGQIGLDLPELVATALAKTPTVGWGEAIGSHTSVDELTSRFQITSGLWSAEYLRARSGSTLYTASGMINVPASVLDLTVTRSSILAQNSDSGHDPGTAVLVRGPWRSPLLQPATNKAAQPIAPPLEPAPATTTTGPAGRG